MIIHGDSIEELKKLDADSIDAIVTDPPYGLSNHSATSVADTIAKWATGETDYIPTGKGFMGKSWDSFVPPPALWGEALRVLKPGAHALIFAGSRTQDLMGLSLRLAGFEVRDVVQWIYGEGFPKSLNVSKAIDDELGSQSWEGWGTALKPAYEPCLLVRKPLAGTVAGNVLKHGTGALNIDGCRIGAGDAKCHAEWDRLQSLQSIWGIGSGIDISAYRPTGGRWPSNVIFDEESAPLLGDQARFFYCAKASRGEREAGCDPLEGMSGAESVNRKEGSAGLSSPRAGAGRTASHRKNIHPTVKPIDLMRYLIRLITPKGGTVLDPFNGSGSTGCAAAIEKRDYIGIELNSQYVEIAKARIEYWSKATSYETPGKPSETDGVDLFNWRDHD